MFSIKKYFGCLSASFIFAVLLVVALPEGADTFIILFFVMGAVSLTVKSVHAIGIRLKTQSDVLFSGLTDFQASNSASFVQGEARVRELGVLLRRVEGAVAGLGELQGVKFDENEGRVRGLGVLLRRVEGAVAGLGELQGVKFDENEGRVRGLGVLLRKVETVVADLTQSAQSDRDSQLEEIERQAKTELRFRVLDDLAAMRQLLESGDRELVGQRDSYGS